LHLSSPLFRLGLDSKKSPGFLNRDSPDESQTGINVRVFPAFLQDRREVLTATSTPINWAACDCITASSHRTHAQKFPLQDHCFRVSRPLFFTRFYNRIFRHGLDAALPELRAITSSSVPLMLSRRRSMPCAAMLHSPRKS